ncbi:hypothetical protein BJ742DRAFT_747227 [Cladochytrium replicatum]|nr:hypothetical protein BJ742DRAFT_747227 [Cladochytrium replicatum]
MSTIRPPLPPFNAQTAHAKVKAAQNLWNTKDPEAIARAYTEDTVWRNRTQFLNGHAEVIDFLSNKYKTEHGYRLRKELFSFTENKIAVQFWYEYQDDCRQWWRVYGIEHWTFAEDGRMKKRMMSASDLKISDSERWFKGGVDIDKFEIQEPRF